MKIIILLSLLISITQVNSQVPVWTCNFEADMCNMQSGTYINTVSNQEQNDFARTNSRRPPSGIDGFTGPQDGAKEGAYYIYFEASFRRTEEKGGEITSPQITLVNGLNNVRVTFWYYDHGFDLGVLSLTVINSDSSQTVYTINDGTTPSLAWNFTSISIPNPGSPFTIRFSATTKGGYTSDWGLDDIQIIADQNGCASQPCVALASCTNLGVNPFFSCSCPSGYSGDGRNDGNGCSDVNECLTGICTGANIDCLNTDGSYTCQRCLARFEYDFGSGNSYSCKDIDECLAGRCIGANINCVNSIGSYSCQQCLSGFEYELGSGDSFSCRDTNECLDANFCTGANTECINQFGAQAICRCQVGYQLQSSNEDNGRFALVCTPTLANECLNNPCPTNSFCTDLNQGYTCTCNGGYNGRAGTNGNNLICDDVNECLSVTCDADADCANFVGTYNCVCRSGFTQSGQQTAAQCFVNGGLSDWTNVGGCSQICGGGTQEQIRTCTNPPPEVGGLGCDAVEPLARTVTCNTNPCTECEYSKPCSCNQVTRYQTGAEPTSSLVHFQGINPQDIETALRFLTIWNHGNFESFCAAANCNPSQLLGGISNVTVYVNNIVAIDEANEKALADMREIIDCNENADIEGNLWNIYDLLCDRGVAITNIKHDLMQKRKMFEAEKQRCDKRSWFGSMVEKFYKKY